MKKKILFGVLCLIAVGVCSSALILRVPRSNLALHARNTFQVPGTVITTLGAPLNLPSLISQATVIVVGRVVGVSATQELGPTVNKSFLVTVQIGRTLKGSVDKSSITVKVIKERNRMTVAKGITPSLYGMFFLNRESPHVYVLADRDVQALVATEGPRSPRADPLDRVVDELARVISSLNNSPQDELQAVVALSSVDSPAANEALRRALEIKDENVRLEAQTGLLKHNDLSMLAEVEDSLMSATAGLPENRILRLSNGIRDGIRNPKAISILSRLLLAKDARVRRAAAHALRETRVDAAVEPLSTALDDSDQMVRYDAVIGLAEIKADLAHAPSVDAFKRDEQTYITYWKQRIK